MSKAMKQKQLRIFLIGAIALLVPTGRQPLAKEEAAKPAAEAPVPPPESPEEMALTEEAAQGSPEQRGIGAAGKCTKCECQIRAHHPHNSGHKPGRVNGEVRIECQHKQPKLEVTAQLWETRWWGWDRIGAEDEGKATNKRQVSAYGNSRCNNGMTIRVTGSGNVTQSNGKHIVGKVESKHVKIKKCTR